jgi:hypothetical protein
MNGRSLLLALCLTVPALLSAQMKGTGRVQIESISTYSGAEKLPKPSRIVVYDFATSDEDTKLNSSTLSRVRTGVRRDGGAEREELGEKVKNDLAEALVKNLAKTGIPTSRAIGEETEPAGALIVRGEFLLIDEGNRARRMGIGLGAGASKVKAHVKCSLQASGRETVLSEFEAKSESSRKPGAAETMGAGAAPEVAAAASGVTELNQGAEGDAGRMAKAISKQISKSLKENGWIEESK